MLYITRGYAVFCRLRKGFLQPPVDDGWNSGPNACWLQLADIRESMTPRDLRTERRTHRIHQLTE